MLIENTSVQEEMFFYLKNPKIYSVLCEHYPYTLFFCVLHPVHLTLESTDVCERARLIPRS